MRLSSARAVADAVLLEGYLLYPYRASAPKNHYRWQFGVLAPRAWSEAGGCEPWWMQTQFLVCGGAAIEGQLRLLQLTRRQLQRAAGDGFADVDSLEVDGRLYTSFDEGELREVPLAASLDEAVHEPLSLSFALPGGSDADLLRDAAGQVAGQMVRRRWPVRGRVAIAADRLSDGLARVSVRVDNETPWRELAAPRPDALRGACLSTHLVLAIDGGSFVSLTDPPDWARAAADGCVNVRAYPVLAGEPGRDDLLLCAPIILYDHPEVAPESPGDFFDATEIDELLALRTATLTDEEKRQARATDARAAAIVDRVDNMPPEVMERLHGAIRGLRAAEGTPGDEADSVDGYRAGARVRLRPGVRRTDAQDLLYAGHTATIEKIMRDIEGRALLAVTIDDDPAAALHRWYGRFHYYYPDEVEPV